jgi:hypothetical protein
VEPTTSAITMLSSLRARDGVSGRRPDHPRDGGCGRSSAGPCASILSSGAPKLLAGLEPGPPGDTRRCCPWRPQRSTQRGSASVSGGPRRVLGGSRRRHCEGGSQGERQGEAGPALGYLGERMGLPPRSCRDTHPLDRLHRERVCLHDPGVAPMDESGRRLEAVATRRAFICVSCALYLRRALLIPRHVDLGEHRSLVR